MCDNTGQVSYARKHKPPPRIAVCASLLIYVYDVQEPALYRQKETQKGRSGPDVNQSDVLFCVATVDKIAPGTPTSGCR